MPDDDLAADMYEAASDLMEEASFEQYEISNWAKRDLNGKHLSCLHNLQYWRLLPYLGFGAGAHGFAVGVRTANILSPTAYIQRMTECDKPIDRLFPATAAVVETTSIEKKREMGEYMMMGLRLVQEGVCNADFSNRFGISLDEAYSQVIQSLLRKRLLEWKQTDRLCLTRSARLVANQVFCEFV
jgi:oxygen-independent coproporphyrinogen-3 oxidase